MTPYRALVVSVVAVPAVGAALAYAVLFAIGIEAIPVVFALAGVASGAVEYSVMRVPLRAAFIAVAGAVLSSALWLVSAVVLLATTCDEGCFT
jgi:hypothetical protein